VYRFLDLDCMVFRDKLPDNQVSESRSIFLEGRHTWPEVNLIAKPGVVQRGCRERLHANTHEKEIV
jgi:hypothetical protein